MTLETILRTVLHAVAWSALIAFCGVVAGVGIHWILRLLCHALAETGRRCGKWAAVTLASLALVCAVVAQKANTNDAPNGVSAPAPMMSAARGAPETYSQNPTNAPETSPLHLGSVARGAPQTFPPRLAAQIPANAQDVEEWELRGAYDDAIRIPAMGWDFRTPDGFVEGMTVFSRGEFRPDVGHLYFPRPFTNDLSLLPRAKWHLLHGVAATPSSSQGGGCDGEGAAATSGCDGEGARPCRLPSEAELLRRISATPESKLWYAATPSNSLLVTWVNGLLDRNPLTPTNFQAEFFPDGSYEYRYGDYNEPHPFTLPFDWDGDGLENTVDPEPETAGPDAQNTNAEWYNVVCSNVLSTVEGDSFTWRSGVNSNAYYFVEVTVPRGPAPVYFVADGPSDLGNPVIVATAGATSRVPLLIGATYAVTSDTPFTVSVPDASNIAISPTGATSYQVRWPIIFEDAVTEVDGHPVHAFTPSSDLGGTFNWSVTSGGASSDAGPSLMSGTPSGGCGFTSTGNQAWFACAQENCGCGGRPGTAGYASLSCDLELLPRTVSFHNISVREIPATGASSDGSHTDYFNQEYFRVDWYHTADHGAGNWWSVGEPGNKLVTDNAVRAKPCPRPWGTGTLSWSNPIAWRPNSEINSGDTADRVFCAKPQVFTFDARGVLKVEKFGHSAERSAGGDYWCDGAYNQWLSNEEKGMGHD